MLRISTESLSLYDMRERASIEREAAWAIELSQRREAVARWRGSRRRGTQQSVPAQVGSDASRR